MDRSETDTRPLSPEVTAQARAWEKTLRAYSGANTRKSLIQLALTGGLFVACYGGALYGVMQGAWIALLLTVPAAAFLVRLFMIQHDCGHRAFFRTRRANDWLGSVIGVVTLTPHTYWRVAHALHHATSGNLDRRGIGDIAVMTVREYRALPGRRKLLYRLYRHPLVLFGLGPAFLFVFKFRLPLDVLRMRKRTLPNVLLTDAAIAAAVLAMGLAFGFGNFLAVQLPVTLLASLAGTWFFYVQHQFADTYWARNEDWNFHRAALTGASHYVLPRWLGWLTADIGIHHVHHLCGTIPNYRLRDCLRDHPALAAINRLTLRDSVKCVRLALWDEDRGRLVGFAAA